MYKPRQLSYTNTVSTMGRMGEKKNIINDYCEIRDKYEKNIISRMLKENNSDKDDYIIDINHDIIVNEIVDNPGYTFPNTDNIVTINERPCILLDLKYPPIENITYTLTYNTHNVYN